ncbi:MAG: alginate O-acetyltransferase AlgX-related protein [Myxococcota bacterium]
MGALEVSVRLLVDFEQQKPFGVYDVDPANRHLSFLPGRSRHYATSEFSFDAHYNAFGRRDVEWSPAVVADPNSVLFIGDSFAYGIGVDHEETLPTQLEVRFAQAGRPAEVMNFGMPGNGAPPGYAMLLDDAIEKGFAARTVVVAIFVGNDFYPSVLTPLDGAPAAPAPADSKNGGSLLSHWKSFELLRLRVSQSARLVGWALTLGRMLGISVYDGAGTYVFLRERTPEQDALFQRILGHIGVMKQTCDETDRRLFAVILPNRIQVENREAFTSAVYDAARPHRDVLRYCEQLGISCLDLLPVLSEAYLRDGEPLFFPVDRHLNPRGYRLVGEAIASFLLAEGAP